METIDSLNPQSSAGHQLLKTLRERGIVDGSDFVKERQQKHRDQSAQNQRDQQPATGRPQPPGRPAVPQEAVQSQQQYQTQRPADHITFDLLPSPLKKRLVAQLIAVFQNEA